MKKTYQELQINVISLDAADVIATSLADKSLDSFLNGNFNLGELNVQDFS